MNQFLLTLLVFFAIVSTASSQSNSATAQQRGNFSYIPADSARLMIKNAKTLKEKFNGYRGLDRYYYITGQNDSSARLQKEMYTIAKQLKDDSLMARTFIAIANRYVFRADYNFSLNYDFKALEYAKSSETRGVLYSNIGNIYGLTGNNQLAAEYLKKATAIQLTDAPHIKGHNSTYTIIFHGQVFNNLGQPDSALAYLQKAGPLIPKNADPLMNSVLLGQMGKAYELKGDTDLANVYYNKAMAYCKQRGVASEQIHVGSLYGNFFIKLGKYEQAKAIALDMLEIAKRINNLEGISNTADMLRKVYVHKGNRDSAYYYAEMQISYKDSVSNQKRLAEFQNLTFGQQLREIDEQAKEEQATEQRHQNIQYAAIALVLVLLIMLFLLLSRSVMVNTRTIEIVGVIGLLIVFEFINLVVHPYLAHLTRDSPILMLLILVLIAAIIVPLHHRLEHWIKHKLVEKNKAIQLAAAKRTIEKLEGGK